MTPDEDAVVEAAADAMAAWAFDVWRATGETGDLPASGAEVVARVAALAAERADLADAAREYLSACDELDDATHALDLLDDAPRDAEFAAVATRVRTAHRTRIGRRAALLVAIGGGGR